jgi:transposase
MPAYRTVRPLTADEAETLERLARSRTAPARAVERAAIVWQAHQGVRVPVIADRLGVCAATVRTWLRRFNADGLAGLADAPRAGRPATYPPEAIGELIAASLTKPDALGLPFGSWTLDRLATYLNAERGIAIKRSRIGEILQAEGLRWRTQETWCGERPDPAFAAKRGPSSASTPRHLSRVS